MQKPPQNLGKYIVVFINIIGKGFGEGILFGRICSFGGMKIVTNDYIDEQKIISQSKFIILLITTFGMYGLWWIYKAWRFFNQREKSDIMPAVRATMCIIFLPSLFNKIIDYAKEKGYKEDYPILLLYGCFIILSMTAYFPAPVVYISPFCVLFLIPPFQALNYAKRHSLDFIIKEQKKFSGLQITVIVLGSIFWLLLLIVVCIKA